MTSPAGFSYQPTTPVVGPTPPSPAPVPGPAPTPSPLTRLGPLAGLVGKWAGTGFNAIWRPDHTAGTDRFLELNMTTETLTFEAIDGDIPNRGLLQDDLTMTGVSYLQKISDSNLKAGLHLEPGLWLSVPATTNPAVPSTVARLASIPHGTTIVAQGLATASATAPHIPPVSLDPFSIGNPAGTLVFAEQTLATASNFRTSGPGLDGITQAVVDNPNSVLTAAAAGLSVASTTMLQISSDKTPVLGGGTANIAFLQGDIAPNADAALIAATFWLQTTQGAIEPDLLQYTQTVLLNFSGLSWPHVSVATLRRQPSS